MVYFKEDLKNKNKIDILPMIDIIFSILAFLIISSLYLTRVETLSVELPKASNSITQNKNLVVLNADENVSHGYVISVLDVLRSIDGLKLAISIKSLD